MKQSLVILSLALLASTAPCTPEIHEAFVKLYAPKSKLATMTCYICHVEPPTRNPYGKAVKEAKKGPIEDSVFRTIEALDSDGDGFSNIDEIEADTAPGEAKDKPAGTPSMPTSSPAERGGLIPKHGFHPLIVHFPIALFIFGAFLELVGFRTRQEDARKAGWWCILAGGSASVFAVGSGLLAFNLNGYAFQGPPLIHFALASSAVVAMLSTVAWRRKGPIEKPAYFALLILGAVLVGLAGHFGANLVYN